MATVYLAEDALERSVALKILAPTTLADPSAEERFLKEGKIIAGLSHPNIVTVYTSGRCESMYYMAIEYIKGGNLIPRIRQGLTVQNTFDICKQIASALGYAHKRGYIHRDVKPANILFRENGTAVLSDFGIARDVVSQTHLTAIGQAIGTPEYMSPEQITGSPLDARCDLYCLGVVLYEMLTRQKPFKGEDAISTAMRHLRDPVPQLPKPLTFCQPLIDRLLAKDPNERFATAEQFIQVLEEVSAKAAWFTEPSRPHRWLKTIAWAGGVGVLIIVVGTAVYWQMAHHIDPQTQMIINMLLSQAEQQMAASQLTEPAGDNAYQKYHYILEYFDPRNDKALTGLKKIADRLEKQALAKQQQKLFEESLQLTEQGLKIDPQHGGLRALRKELSQQLEQRRRRREVARLLAKAEQQLAATHLMEPEDDNAYQSYRSVLKLDPHNQQALAGMQEIASRIEQQARAKQRQEQYEQGLEMIAQGLLAAPKHSGLLALKKALTQQLEEKRRQQNVSRLLAKANHQLNTRRLVAPKDDNAYITYRKVLELDPQNAQAKAGLGHIAGQIEQLARQRQAEGLFKESLAAAEQGLRVLPEHAGLRALRAEVQAQIDAQARRQREVTQLLAQAEQQLKATQWIEPADDNAYASYQKVLELDPGNARAQTGLEKIAALLERSAAQRRDKGLFQESLTLAERGLRAFPDHTGLQALRAEVRTKIEERARRRQEVQRLSAEAERQLQAAHLTQPEHDNAYASYRKVLELEPGNAEAKAGLEKIAARYETLARQRQAEGALPKSLAVIKRGLQVVPGHAGLQALRTEIQAQIEAQARRQREVAQLLAQAERQLNVSQLIEPADDNATASYRKVLELDPENGKARHGLETIPARIKSLAQSKRQQGRLDQSLSLVGKGLEAFPKHRGLQELHGIIARERAQQQRQRELATLLAKAAAQFADSKFTLPEGDNAFATYQSIQALDSRNGQARQGLQAIAEHFEKQARRNQNEGRLIAALVAINAGLKAVPDDSNLVELQKTIKQRLDEKVRRQRLLSDLAAVAKAHMSASHYTQPDGKNAFQTFSEMLTIDPDNRVALEGLAKIVRHYEQSAQEQYRKGNFEQSLSLVEAGLKVQAKNMVLIALRKEAITQLETQRQQRRVDKLFASAEEQLASSKLLEPEGNNAYESYQQILELSPDSRRAHAGLQQIADQLYRRGQTELEKGALNESMVSIDEGLRVVPDHPGLLDLKDEVTQRLEKQPGKKQLDNLFAKAERQLAAWKLTRPRGDSAYDSYLQILEISPHEERALAGLNRIADRYVELGQTKLDKGSLNESLAMIERGLEVISDHVGLLTLRDKVNQRAEFLRDQRQKLQRLLTLARQNVQAGRLIQPEGNDAHKTYLMALEIDSGNQEAKNGLRQIAEHYENLAKTNQRAGALQKALTMAEIGLKADPHYHGLLSLEKEIRRALNERDEFDRKLARLLEVAQKKLEAGKLTHPEGDNAFEIYQQVLRLDPQNPQALEGLKSMAKKYEALPLQKQRQGDLAQSLLIVEEALETLPKHPGLLSLRSAIARRLREESVNTQNKDEPQQKRHRVWGTF